MAAKSGGKAVAKTKEKKLRYEDEKTRLHYLFRSGLVGKGQSKAIPYTAGTKKHAEKVAKEMVDFEMKRRRL